jgi:hypothetical protein
MENGAIEPSYEGTTACVLFKRAILEGHEDFVRRDARY